MSGPDPLEELARELRALPRRERRAVLDSLSAVEREKLTALLAGAAAPAQPRPPVADGHDLFSLCLTARLGDGDEPGDVRWAMTPSARLLLRQSALFVLERSAPAAARRGPARRSLAGAVGDLLWRAGRPR